MDENQGNQETLELTMQANFHKVLSETNSIKNSLTQVGQEIKNIKINIDDVGKVKGFTIATQKIKQTKAEADKLNSFLLKTQKIINTGFNFGKLYLLWNITKRIRDAIAGMIEKSVDFIETTNKFEVAMGNMSGEAYKFQNRLSEAFGTVRTDMMNFQATFKNIMSSLPRINK